MRQNIFAQMVRSSQMQVRSSQRQQRNPQEAMLEALAHFRVIIRSVRQHYQDVERRAGLSGAQLWALAEVAENRGLKVGELARAMAVHQSTASNLARRLYDLGLVRRARKGRDLRHVQLFTTPKGVRLLGRAPRPSIGVLQQALSELPAARLRELNRALTSVVSLMKVKSAAAARALPLSDMK
jgi:DNA-binding MarR family transcriptional regulator